MGRIINGLLKIAALVGIAAAVKKLSEKENRDAVMNEYQKAKENPKEYAQNVQSKVTEKAQEVQGKAKEEYSKAKDDPKSYAQDVQSKVTEQAKDYQSKMTEQAKQYQEQAKEEIDKMKDESEESESDDSNIDVETEKNEKGNSDYDVKPDAEDGDGHLTTDQEEGNFDSEGGILHPEETPGAEVVSDKGDINDNHNIHVVYDEDSDENSDKNKGNK